MTKEEIRNEIGNMLIVDAAGGAKAQGRRVTDDTNNCNTQDRQGKLFHIDLQLSERCNVLTLCSEVLGLVERLNGSSPQVTGLHAELEQSGQSIQMEFSDNQVLSSSDCIFEMM